MCKSLEDRKKDPWSVKCCAPNSRELECQPSDQNRCSQTYKESQFEFYTHCPLINTTSCGLKNKDDGLVLETQDKTNK